ncbi:hypothetical protein R83H12_00002 [Fibrobacteria bacterium R8-3-H12]
MSGGGSFLGLALVGVLGLVGAAAAAAVDVTNMTTDYEIKEGDIISGTNGDITIYLPNNQTRNFTIKNLVMINGAGKPAISIGTLPTNANIGTAVAKMTISGSNNIKGGIGAAAVRVPTGSQLTIEGDADGNGYLFAKGGEFRSTYNIAGGAGIGGGYARSPGATTNNVSEGCGTVIINGGRIDAYGSSSGLNSTTNITR